MPRSPLATVLRLRFRYTGILAAVLFLVVAILISLRSPSASSQAQFANPAFRTTWERTDGPVASGAVQRGWVWGPIPGIALTEPFEGLPGNAHLVQYFDKGRMEINDPNANPNDPFYVTNGLLAAQLISGLETVGLTKTIYLGPATINLASDQDDLSAPTYQSFNGVSNIPDAPNDRRAAPATGQPVNTAIDRQGITQPWPEDHSDYGVTNAYYENITGHNIPNVFWEFLNSQGPIIQNGQLVQGPLFFPTFSITGYPISEPYWSYVKVNGKYTDVLIQAYERRILTFVPANPSGWKVELGNDGQHYYSWRYGSGSTGGGGAPPPTPTVPLPRIANVQIQGISYPQSVVDINGSYVILENLDERPVLFNGWRIDAPNWSFVNTYYFPNGVVLASGATLNVRSGIGTSTATDLFMFRSTAMWVIDPSNTAILYDQYGRTVSSFFPAGAPPPPPTALAATPTPLTQPPTVTPIRTGTVTPTGGTPPPGAGTVTPTKSAPSPLPTSSPAALP